MQATPKIALIADDLTGAMDSAIPFQICGLRTVVATDLRHLSRALDLGADVVAVSLNSRERTASEAAVMASEAAKMLASAETLFKKIDSRLKGHVAEETAAIVATRGATQAFFCPAIPEMGRFVKKGALVGFGVAEPILLPMQFGSIRAISPDISSTPELDTAIQDLPLDCLFVGARGLAAALAKRLTKSSAAPSNALPLPQPISFLVGSRDPITLAQVADLRAAFTDLHYLPAPNGACASTARLAAITLLQTLPGSAVQSQTEVKQAFAATALRLAVQDRQTLVITGGETAAAVLTAMGIGVLDLLGEPLPGLTLARGLDFPGAPLIMTKSGGFGAKDVLTRLLHPAE